MGLSVFFILCNLATLLLSVLTVIHTQSQWRLPSIKLLLLFATCFFFNSLGTINIYISNTFEMKSFFFYFRILATLFSVPTWLYFISTTFDYWSWLRKKWVVALIYLPCAINFLMILLPSTRPLLFYDLKPFEYRDLSVISFRYGPWYFLFYSWSMIWALAAYVLGGTIFVKEKGYRRRQIAVLNIGLAFAFMENIFSSFSEENRLLSWIMFSSFSYLLTQMGIVYAVLKFRLFNIIPLATTRIFQKLPDPVLVLDDHHRLMGVNDKAFNLFNLNKNFLGQRIERILPSLQLSQGELAFKDSTGKYRDFHLVIEEIGADAHGSLGKVVFLRDINEQKHAERRLGEGLEFRTRLLALLAHDLTSFLENQTLLSLELQKGAASRELDVTKLDLLTNSAVASQQLVYNIMGWVKTQQNHFQLDKRPFEWGFLIKETLEQLQPHSLMKGVEIVYDSYSEPVFAMGDSEMLASVLRNILTNSLRATPREHRIFVSLKILGDHAQIRIKDEGRGMTPEEVQKIYDSSKEFFLTGLSKRNGAGIGLMIARHFINLHGGIFEMKSNLGRGTEVVFSAPL